MPLLTLTNLEGGFEPPGDVIAIVGVDAAGLHANAKGMQRTKRIKILRVFIWSRLSIALEQISYFAAHLREIIGDF